MKSHTIGGRVEFTGILAGYRTFGGPNGLNADAHFKDRQHPHQRRRDVAGQLVGINNDLRVREGAL